MIKAEYHVEWNGPSGRIGFGPFSSYAAAVDWVKDPKFMDRRLKRGSNVRIITVTTRTFDTINVAQRA